MIFLVGGARSGKSSVAVATASEIGAPVRFIATAQAGDAEMTRRIEEHRRHRPNDWDVVEAPIDVETALTQSTSSNTVILDCVTLWVSNLLPEYEDKAILERVDSAIGLIRRRSGRTIVVSNEVGTGLVPMDPVGRRFRDLQGRANQMFAAAADSAYLVVAGKALRLEDSPNVG